MRCAAGPALHGPYTVPTLHLTHTPSLPHPTQAPHSPFHCTSHRPLHRPAAQIAVAPQAQPCGTAAPLKPFKAATGPCTHHTQASSVHTHPALHCLTHTNKHKQTQTHTGLLATSAVPCCISHRPCRATLRSRRRQQRPAPSSSRLPPTLSRAVQGTLQAAMQTWRQPSPPSSRWQGTAASQRMRCARCAALCYGHTACTLLLRCATDTCCTCTSTDNRPPRRRHWRTTASPS